MNKLFGFYELNRLSLPTVPWKKYDPSVELDSNLLWTIRSAVNNGDDLNLPRLVGKGADEAKSFADDLYKKIHEKGMVIYYPYFVAHKSGTLNVFLNKTIIESVKFDLWNMVTNQDLDVSYTLARDYTIHKLYGNPNLLNEYEFAELVKNAKKIHSIFRNELLEEKSILLEWSFASNCDIKEKPIGNQYLVFYEIRTV